MATFAEAKTLISGNAVGGVRRDARAPPLADAGCTRAQS